MKLFAAVFAATALVATSPAFADILSTTGSVEITAGSIAFYPLGGTTGDFNIGPPDTGIFAGLVGTSGVIMDLNNAAEPINTMVNIPNFMTFNGASNLSFTLTELLGGTGGPCPGPPPMANQTCTVPGTPYNLTNISPTSSYAAFTVQGYVVDKNNPGTQTPFTGIFTTQFVNENLQQVVQAVETGGTVDATYSAQFVTTPVSGTPEPGTMLSFLIGGVAMVGISLIGKRVRAARQA